MSDLADFLLARIAEDERRVDSIPEWYCTDSARGDGWGSRGECPLCDRYMFDGTESATKEAFWDHYEDIHRRTRVLAECDAKRRIVEDATQGGDCQGHPGSYQPHGEYGPGYCRDFSDNQYLRLLALPYADHEAYRAEWRP